MVWREFVEAIRVMKLQYHKDVREHFDNLEKSPDSTFVYSLMDLRENTKDSEFESILNYLSYWREDKLLDEISSCKEDCCDDPLEPGAMVFFSMPPSFRYTVKATGDQFRSHEEDHYKAYVEYLRSKL